MAKALEDLGWETIKLDTPRDLDRLEEALKKKPSLALATKADGMTEDMAHMIRKRSIPFIIWYPDPVPPEPHMIKMGKVSDFFFTMTQGRIDDYLKEGIKNVAWLTQAFEPSFFPDTPLTREDREYFGSDVAFVGNLGMLPQYRPRRQMLEQVLKAGFSLKWWGPKTPRKLKNIPFLMSKVARSYGGQFVALETFSKVARAAKVFLSLDSFPEVRLSMSVRIYTAVGCGAFYMCKHVEGIEEVMMPGKEIEVFHDYEEMIDKIRFYLKNEEKRKKIAEAGRKRVLKDHTYQVRFKTMFEILGKAGLIAP